MKTRNSHWRAGLALAVGLIALGFASRAAGQEGVATPAPPDAKAKPTYRWGAGWDEGLALRARLGNGWGLGLRLNPDWIDPEDQGSSTYKSSSEWQCLGSKTCINEYDSTSESTTNGDISTFSGALMLYHEKKLGKWLSAGPYLAVSYERRSLTQSTETEGKGQSQYTYPYAPPTRGTETTFTETVKTRRWERKIGVELGVRPTFRFHERFVLETRFGLELGSTRWNETQERSYEQEGDSIYYPYPVEIDIARLPSSRSTSTEKTERKGTERRVRTVGERLGPGAELRFVILF